MIKHALPFLAAALIAVAGLASAQSMGGLTIGEPAPMVRPPSQQSFADNMPDHPVRNFFPNTCLLEFPRDDGSITYAYADGCDGPLLELTRTSQAWNPQAEEIATLSDFFTFGETTVIDVVDLLGGSGTFVADFGDSRKLSPSNRPRLLYRVQNTDTFLIFRFQAVDPDTDDTNAYFESLLSNISLVDPAFFGALYFGTDATIPEHRIKLSIDIFNPDG